MANILNRMSRNMKNNSTLGLLIVGLFVTYLLLINYNSKKMYVDNETFNQEKNKAYENNKVIKNENMYPQPAQEGSNEVFSSLDNVSNASMERSSVQNPSDLLPRDNNSKWADLNPSGKGDLANINLLKAGYHIGIDTIGQTLRNANLQIRSEPPNPQINVGPWNQSTITPDYMRPPLELGQGGQ